MVEVSGPTWTTSAGGHSHDGVRALDVVPKYSKCDGDGDNGCEGEAGRWLSAGCEIAKGVETPTRCFVEVGLNYIKMNQSLMS